jgi:hydrogenase expression/formation protein HypC
MCLAMPARIVAIDADGMNGVVECGGIRKSISLALLPAPRMDDYVLLHVGYAIATIDPLEAKKTLALFAEAGLVVAPPAGEGG